MPHVRGVRRAIWSSVVSLTIFSCAYARAADDPDTEIARRHFLAGAKLYDDAKYDEAIAEFTAARAVKTSPAFDYNIARAYDRLERIPPAVEWYSRFIGHAPDGAEKTEAIERVALLRVRLPAENVARPAEAPRERRYPYAIVAPITFSAAGAAALVVGGVLYGISGPRYDQLAVTGCGSQRICTASTWGETRTMERTGIGLLVTGGVFCVGSVALWAGRRAR